MNGPAGKAVEPEQDETESDENDQEEPETDEFDSLMEDDEDFGEEDGYEDEDDLLKGMDFLNDIDNAETMEIPVREVKKSKPAKKAKKPVQYVCIQEMGGLSKTIEEGKKHVCQMQKEADAVPRTEADLSDLILGLECGGSDPTSGFSSNTVLGLVTDEVIDAGGTAILSETVECIGAEHILRQNGRTPEIGEQIYQAILDWEQKRYEESGQDVRCGNPSPGNMAGGITTLTEKSLGCIHKAGSRPFDGCFEYGQWIDKKGLYFVNAAASDVLSVTALAAAGATLVAFTTGLGNPIGNPVTPVVKITGNHDTAEALCEIIDIDTSIRGEKSLPELKTEMLSVFADVMNGKKTRAEENGANELSINQCYSYA